MRPRERRRSLASPPTPKPTICPALALPKNPRREESGAVQQRTVVVVTDEVPDLGCLIAVLSWPGQRLDLHRVRGVVEVDDVHIKDEHS